MLNKENNKNNLEIFETSKTRIKNNTVKWYHFKTLVSKQCSNISDIKDKSVYIKTLSAASVKRTLCRIYERVFKSRHSGYEKFLTDEEKRLYLLADNNRMPPLVERF